MIRSPTQAEEISDHGLNPNHIEPFLVKHLISTASSSMKAISVRVNEQDASGGVKNTRREEREGGEEKGGEGKGGGEKQEEQ